MTDLQWEHLSNQAIGAAGVVYFLALLSHLVEWSALRTVPVKATLRAAVPAGSPAPPVEEGRQDPPRDPGEVNESTRFRVDMFGRLALMLTVLGCAAHLLALVARGMAADPNRVPWGNMYEFTITGSFVVVAGYLLLRKRYGLDWMGPIVTAMVVVLLMVAVLWLYSPIEPLTEALNSYWLVIHVMSAIVATGAFTLGGITSALYLVRARAEKRELRRRPRLRRPAALAGRPGPRLLPDPRLRVPGVDLRGPDQRADLGAPGLVVVLELGPEGGLRLHHLGGVRRLPARPRDRGLAWPERRDRGPGRRRHAVVQLHRDQLLLDHEPALVRQRRRRRSACATADPVGDQDESS